jgi:hypothetical protein
MASRSITTMTYALLLAALLGLSSGFVSKPFARTQRQVRKEQVQLQAVSLPMTETSVGCGMDYSPLLSTMTPFLLSVLPVDMLLDPSVEAEVLNGFSHVAIDFAGFLPKLKSCLRIMAIIGRIFAISADYLQHHSIYSQNLDINCLLIAIGLADMIKSRRVEEEKEG